MNYLPGPSPSLIHTQTPHPPAPPNMPLPSFALSHSIDNPLGVWRYSSMLICLSGQVKVRYTTFCIRIFKNKKQNTHTHKTHRELWRPCKSNSRWSDSNVPRHQIFPSWASLKITWKCPVMSHCTALITADRSWNHLEADEV